jgi:hypothetical protein
MISLLATFSARKWSCALDTFLWFLFHVWFIMYLFFVSRFSNWALRFWLWSWSLRLIRILLFSTYSRTRQTSTLLLPSSLPCQYTRLQLWLFGIWFLAWDLEWDIGLFLTFLSCFGFCYVLTSFSWNWLFLLLYCALILSIPFHWRRHLWLRDMWTILMLLKDHLLLSRGFLNLWFIQNRLHIELLLWWYADARVKLILLFVWPCLYTAAFYIGFALLLLLLPLSWFYNFKTLFKWSFRQ